MPAGSTGAKSHGLHFTGKQQPVRSLIGLVVVHDHAGGDGSDCYTDEQATQIVFTVIMIMVVMIVMSVVIAITTVAVLTIVTDTLLAILGYSSGDICTLDLLPVDRILGDSPLRLRLGA